jgi:hypothetical protein
VVWESLWNDTIIFQGLLGCGNTGFSNDPFKNIKLVHWVNDWIIITWFWNELFLSKSRIWKDESVIWPCYNILLHENKFQLQIGNFYRFFQTEGEEYSTQHCNLDLNNFVELLYVICDVAVNEYWCKYFHGN